MVDQLPFSEATLQQMSVNDDRVNKEVRDPVQHARLKVHMDITKELKTVIPFLGRAFLRERGSPDLSTNVFEDFTGRKRWEVDLEAFSKVDTEAAHFRSAHTNAIGLDFRVSLRVDENYREKKSIKRKLAGIKASIEKHPDQLDLVNVVEYHSNSVRSHPNKKWSGECLFLLS